MSKHSAEPSARVTVHTLRAMKARSERIAMVTAYDATFARMLDEGGADMLLVGDSLGMVVQGQDSTLPVTMDEMLYHCRAVARGSQRAHARRRHAVHELPGLVRAGACATPGRFLAEGGVHAVKLEGGVEVADTIRRIVAAGIPVMGHVGLTPQSVHAMGGFRVQGKARRGRRSACSTTRARSPKRARSRSCSRAYRPSSRAHHRRAGDPDDRHRRRRALRRPGARLLRPARPHARAERRSSSSGTRSFYDRGVEAMRRFCDEVRAATSRAQSTASAPIAERSTPGERRLARGPARRQRAAAVRLRG